MMIREDEILRLATAISFLILFPAEAMSACVGDVNTLISGKNRFACPLVLVPPLTSAGTVRESDACAREGGRMTSNRGQSKKHNALDINSAEGATEVAAMPGMVAVSADWDPNNEGKNMGQVIIIDHEDGDYTVYGHLQARSVSRGSCVSAGDAIGTVGFTGNGECLRRNGLPAHLHFAVIRAVKAGLADANTGPIAAAVKNANDWLEFGADFWGNDVVDLGIKDPERILLNLSGCISR